MREEVVFSFVKTLLRNIYAGFTIARVRKCLHMGKMSVFSMLLEGEASMVRWHPNVLDLNRFHDLVGSS